MTIDRDIQTTKGQLRTVSTLIGEALSQFAKLFQNEVDLAKAELGEKIKKVGGAVGLLGAGALLVIPGLVMALFALSAALITRGWSQPVSYMLSSVLALVLAGILFALGISQLNAQHLVPRETI